MTRVNRCPASAAASRRAFRMRAGSAVRDLSPAPLLMIASSSAGGRDSAAPPAWCRVQNGFEDRLPCFPHGTAAPRSPFRTERPRRRTGRCARRVPWRGPAPATCRRRCRRLCPGLVRCSLRVRSWRSWRRSPASLVTLASPKSRILACPRLVTKMLAGLMSRWTMPSAWAASSASAISMASARSDRVPSGACDAVLQCRPSRNSMTMKVGLLLANLVDGADVGMVQRGSGAGFALEAARGLVDRGRLSGRNFRATKRPSFVSSAL